MSIISWEAMQALDANCLYFGLLPLQLMANAGAAIAREVVASSPGKRAAIVAGRGNNGGDALLGSCPFPGHNAPLSPLGGPRGIPTPAARRDWERPERLLLGFAEILGRWHLDLREIKDAEELMLDECDLIVDAIFGTGVGGREAGLEAEATGAISCSGEQGLSEGIPRGLGNNTTVGAD